MKDNGKGVMPSMKYYSGDHTNQLIPYYAKGAGADVIAALANNYDTKRGYYIDNTTSAMLVKLMWGQLPDGGSTTGVDNIENDGISDFYTNDELIVTNADGMLELHTTMDGEATCYIIDAAGRVLKSGQVIINGGVCQVEAGNCSGFAVVVLSQPTRTLSAKTIIL